MSKTLCERKKDLKHDLESYMQLVTPARFVCSNCGRCANKKKYLCEPERIEVPLITIENEYEYEPEFQLVPA
jgi:hypothetical protein